MKSNIMEISEEKGGSISYTIAHPFRYERDYDAMGTKAASFQWLAQTREKLLLRI